MLNANDPFKHKIDTKVSHPEFGDGVIVVQESDLTKKFPARLCWVKFGAKRIEVIPQDELASI